MDREGQPLKAADDERKAAERRRALEAKRMRDEAALANQRALEKTRLVQPPPPPVKAAAPAPPPPPQPADARKLAMEARRMREEALAANKRAIDSSKAIRRPVQRPMDAWGRARSPYAREPGVEEKLSTLFGQGPVAQKEGREKIRDRARRQSGR